jgi:hypothetical protein
LLESSKENFGPGAMPVSQPAEQKFFAAFFRKAGLS